LESFRFFLRYSKIKKLTEKRVNNVESHTQSTQRKARSINVHERKKEIVALLEEFGDVRVPDMSKRFGVTEETIRKDLQRLEDEGLLLRTFGGATANRRERPELPALNREYVRLEEKMLIGERAATMVQAGEVIAMDASTTCLQMAKFLPNIEINIITNSIAIACELVKKANIEIYLIGGYFDRHSLGNIGTPAGKMLEGYHADKFFFSCQGFDLQQGLSQPYEAHVQLKKNMAAMSDQLILLADSSKFKRKSLIKLMEMEAVSTVVTDSQFPEEAAAEMETSGIRVVVVKS
jgi:DeoR/GlpR family transcriptional regulator of sugar metabolism